MKHLGEKEGHNEKSNPKQNPDKGAPKKPILPYLGMPQKPTKPPTSPMNGPKKSARVVIPKNIFREIKCEVCTLFPFSR